MTEQCQEWIAHCVKKYPCKGDVLEVGSFDVNGNPRHHFDDKRRFENYTGVDMREGPCVDKVMNVQALDFPENHFGVIVDAERLEHDNRFWLSVKELYRVCKPGGYIIVTTRSWGGMHPHAYPHDYWRFMDSGLKDLLEYGGFEVLATAYGERWAAGDKAVFAVGRKPVGSYAYPVIEVPASVGEEMRKFDREEPSFHIVIPSANPENLWRCASEIIANEPLMRPDQFAIVDDGARCEKTENRDFAWVKGEKPFIFARNVNLGIKAANSDVIVLNDDAILETPNGLTELWKHRDKGIVSAVVRGMVGNIRQKPMLQGFQLREEKQMLCFVAVLIPKWVQDRIGLLDERFTGYGFEDNDYCRRAKEAGIGLYIFDGCVVEHGSLRPTFRSRPEWVGDMDRAQRIYQEKWA